MGGVRFSAPRSLVLWARDAFRLTTFIETGTNLAATSVWAAGEFEKVITIEGQPELHAAAVRKYGHMPNIRFHLGDSRNSLGAVLSETGGAALIWLDAHWCGTDTFGQAAECPLLDELEAVNRSNAGHVILIDDARLFTSPPPPPHRAQDWPDLVRLGVALAAGPVRRYAAVFEDVVVAVPEAARDELVRFIREARLAEPFWRRAMRRAIRFGLGQ